MRKVNKTVLLFLILIFVSTPVDARSPLFNVVKRLYQNYSWVAVFQDDAELVGLEGESIPVLRNYFADDLAFAIFNDAHRASLAGDEVGSIDVSILFDSQDPAATDLTLRDEGGNSVLVCFSDCSGVSGERCVRFVGNARGDKIKDIVYIRDGRSLRKTLGLPP